MSQKKRNSLQFQYMFFTSILVIAITLSILLSRSIVTDRYEELSNHTVLASEMLTLTLKLRDNINTLANSIDIVMLEPDFQDQIDLVFKANLKDIYRLLGKIKGSPLIKDIKATNLIDGLAQNIDALNKNSLKLFQIRSDIDQQYPSIQVSSNILSPIRDEITSSLIISFSESNADGMYVEHSELYNQLLNAERLWMRAISAYRLYLANKFGSFNKEGLLGQEIEVDILVDEVYRLSLILQENSVKDIFGLEATELLSDLPALLRKWKAGYAQVKVIHHSDSWRRDAELMRTTILPLVNEVMTNLVEFDHKVEAKNNFYIKELGQLSVQQSFYLIVIAIIFVVYSLVVYMFLKRLVFKPLALFSESIRSGVFTPKDKDWIALAKTEETFALIDSFIEMNHQNIERQDKLAYQAMHDSLTSLPNRKALMVSLKRDMKLSDRNKKPMSFLMLDLNGFKDVNDTLGHHIGDQLLIKVGERIKTLLRDVDMVARLGGDEFSVILPNTDREGAAKVAEKINDSLADDFQVGDLSLHVGASIGVAEYPKDGEDHNLLMQHADVAMYDCKAHKTVYSFYDPDKDEHSLQRLALTNDLKQAIKDNTIEMYYQPKLTVNDSKPIGCEALLRWIHPEFGFISPEKIIEIAERSNLIDELTLLIINNSMADQIKLDQQGYKLHLAINLSVHNLKNESFIQDVDAILKNNQCDASRITFEITESAVMADPEKSIQMMDKLTHLGVKLSVDDFGTGFSSLSYLKKLPVSEMKIDRSFVSDIANDKNDEVIVQSTIDLAHNLGLSVVAEGVEDKASLNVLKRLGCDITQGYYFSKPLPYEPFLKWLKSNPLA